MSKLTLKITAITLILSMFFLSSTAAYAQKTRIKALEQRVSELEAQCSGNPQSHLRAEAVDCTSNGDCANAGACECFGPRPNPGYSPICCSCGYFPQDQCHRSCFVETTTLADCRRCCEERYGDNNPGVDYACKLLCEEYYAIKDVIDLAKP